MLSSTRTKLALIVRLCSALILVYFSEPADHLIVSAKPSTEGRCAYTVDSIISRGFEAQLYTIETNGYPLTLYRIINPLANQTKLVKYPVLYGHGLLYDSMSMISRSENSRPRVPIIGECSVKYGTSREKEATSTNRSTTEDDSQVNDYSLPFMFSNNNFDVWLFDSRGTNNEEYENDPSKSLLDTSKFWEFSLDDQALVDLPLMIDFVLTKTNTKKLVYVGYSQSTLFLFSLLTTAPEYNDKLIAAITMAPVAYVGHIKGLTLPLLGPVDLIPEFVHYSIVPKSVIVLIDNSMKSLCGTKGMSNLICGRLTKGIGGDGVGESAPDFFGNFFKLTSIKAVKQFIQLYSGKRFGMYDYGVAENNRRYNMSKPPAYDLSRFKYDRLIMVRGGRDFLSTPKDQALLLKEMAVKPYLDINITQYNHFDFIDGQNLIELVNEPVMRAVYELISKEESGLSRGSYNPTSDSSSISEGVSLRGIPKWVKNETLERPVESSVENDREGKLIQLISKVAKGERSQRR